MRRCDRVPPPKGAAHGVEGFPIDDRHRRHVCEQRNVGAVHRRERCVLPREELRVRFERQAFAIAVMLSFLVVFSLVAWLVLGQIRPVVLP